MSREYDAAVPSESEVTIPEDVRARLHIEAPGSVTFTVSDDGHVQIRASRYQTLKSLKGIAGSLHGESTWDEMVEIGREDAIRRLQPERREP